MRGGWVVLGVGCKAIKRLEKWIQTLAQMSDRAGSRELVSTRGYPLRPFFPSFLDFFTSSSRLCTSTTQSHAWGKKKTVETGLVTAASQVNSKFFYLYLSVTFLSASLLIFFITRDTHQISEIYWRPIADFFGKYSIGKIPRGKITTNESSIKIITLWSLI